MREGGEGWGSEGERGGGRGGGRGGEGEGGGRRGSAGERGGKVGGREGSRKVGGQRGPMRVICKWSRVLAQIMFVVSIMFVVRFV
jgi:hypothetical protein